MEKVDRAERLLILARAQLDAAACDGCLERATSVLLDARTEFLDALMEEMDAFEADDAPPAGPELAS